MIRLSSAGSRVRIRLSNRYGASPLPVTGATIAVALDGPAIQPGTMHRLTFHEDGLTTSYRASGNHLSDPGAGAFMGATSHSYYYLDGVDVTGRYTRGTVVAFGDSITNGHNSTVGASQRYTDALARRSRPARGARRHRRGRHQ